MVESQVKEKVEDLELDEFPKEIQQAIEGLAWLGHLDTDVTFAGHGFVLRTLKVEEEFQVAKLTQEYLETLGQAKAYATACIALSLVSVDEDADFCPPIGPNKDEYAKQRFNYVASKWYYPLVEHLFGHYMQLINRQVNAINAVKNLSTGSRASFSPSPDFSTDPGDSEINSLVQEMED